jgi:CRISPR-associated endonuclease/helicase Cas3
MCGAHRRDKLDEVRQRLAHGEPCRLVATQVVEAGVDLDFPVVLRALALLDRIVQAAGRCNREGRLERGQVFIFQPAEGSSPPGAYRTGIDITATLLDQSYLDLHDPENYQEYFRRLYQRVDLDGKKIQNLRKGFNYSDVAQRFRLIDEDTEPILVRYRDTLPSGDLFSKVVSDLRNGWGNPREHWRKLQPFVVTARKRQIDAYHRQQLIFEIVPGLWEWARMDMYLEQRGLAVDRHDPAGLVA